MSRQPTQSELERPAESPKESAQSVFATHCFWCGSEFFSTRIAVRKADRYCDEYCEAMWDSVHSSSDKD